MRNMLDFTPYRRSLIGFDHLFNLLDSAASFDFPDDYPRYDVEQEGEDTYRVRLEVAGYSQDNIDVSTHEGVLIIKGRRQTQQQDLKYLHRGIGSSEFERRFQLADHVEVTSANLADGVLTIELKREVPEAAKPKKITIGSSQQAKRLEHTKADPA
jgi:molecular chaperone IbpA